MRKKFFLLFKFLLFIYFISGCAGSLLRVGSLQLRTALRCGAVAPLVVEHGLQVRGAQ